jgi:thiol-disulfide isomerase/thioredoxin
MENVPTTPRSKPSYLVWVGVLAALLVVMLVRELIPRSGGALHGNTPLAIGRQLPDMSLEPVTGATAPLQTSSLAGQVTVVNFWGPWCPFCLDEFPGLLAANKRLSENPKFRFLSIAVPQDPSEDPALFKSQVESYLRSQGTTIPVYGDNAQQHVMQQMAAVVPSFGFPLTLVVDQRGTIRGAWTGYKPGEEKAVEKLARQLLMQ